MSGAENEEQEEESEPRARAENEHQEEEKKDEEEEEAFDFRLASDFVLTWNSNGPRWNQQGLGAGNQQARREQDARSQDGDKKIKLITNRKLEINGSNLFSVSNIIMEYGNEQGCKT